MKYQMHQQNKENRSETIFISDAEFNCDDKGYKVWVKNVIQIHPLPDGFEWLCCNKKSKYFVEQSENADGK
ncbi:hypothetical protein LCGC14_2458380 [marine sediment metagenome]|uniref:Uncharacterized protein n=1 Tax=marine sediment metagenome TaxID=412755 RepID=A0A0F9BEH6_9ZZZZ